MEVLVAAGAGPMVNTTLERTEGGWKELLSESSMRSSCMNLDAPSRSMLGTMLLMCTMPGAACEMPLRTAPTLTFLAESLVVEFKEHLGAIRCVVDIKTRLSYLNVLKHDDLTYIITIRSELTCNT